MEKGETLSQHAEEGRNGSNCIGTTAKNDTNLGSEDSVGHTCTGDEGVVNPEAGNTQVGNGNCTDSKSSNGVHGKAGRRLSLQHILAAKSEAKDILIDHLQQQLEAKEEIIGHLQTRVEELRQQLEVQQSTLEESNTIMEGMRKAMQGMTSVNERLSKEAEKLRLENTYLRQWLGLGHTSETLPTTTQPGSPAFTAAPFSPPATAPAGRNPMLETLQRLGLQTTLQQLGSPINPAAIQQSVHALTAAMGPVLQPAPSTAQPAPILHQHLQKQQQQQLQALQQQLQQLLAQQQQQLQQLQQSKLQHSPQQSQTVGIQPDGPSLAPQPSPAPDALKEDGLATILDPQNVLMRLASLKDPQSSLAQAAAVSQQFAFPVSVTLPSGAFLGNTPVPNMTLLPSMQGAVNMPSPVIPRANGAMAPPVASTSTSPTSQEPPASVPGLPAVDSQASSSRSDSLPGTTEASTMPPPAAASAATSDDQQIPKEGAAAAMGSLAPPDSEVQAQTDMPTIGSMPQTAHTPLESKGEGSPSQERCAESDVEAEGNSMGAIPSTPPLVPSETAAASTLTPGPGSGVDRIKYTGKPDLTSSMFANLSPSAGIIAFGRGPSLDSDVNATVQFGQLYMMPSEAKLSSGDAEIFLQERGRSAFKAIFDEEDLHRAESLDGYGPSGASRRSASMPSRSANLSAVPRRMVDDRKYKTQNELRLIDIVVGLLEDGTMNPYKGSVPVERIQNVVRSQYNQLYNLIVGSRHNSWKRFLEFHPKVFHLFCVDDGKWRMRLVRHCDWREADLQEQEERQSKEFHLISCLATYLRMQPNFSCRVDDFRQAYPNLPQNQPRDGTNEPPYPLPARGDLTRFVRRHPTHFIYDKDNFSIILKQLSEDGTL